MTKVIIVEDTPYEAELLKKLLSKNHPDIELLSVCSNVVEAVEKINLHKPDLVFMDVELGDEIAFKIFDYTKAVSYQTIFTTSHAKYALPAIDAKAVHYLLKPYGDDKLKEAIARYNNLKHPEGSSVIVSYSIFNQTVGIPIPGGFKILPVSDIIFCEAEDSKTKFFLFNQKNNFIINKYLTEVDEILNPHPFFRIHNSCTVNLFHITEYENKGDGIKVALSNGSEKIVARTKKEGFLNALSQWKIILNK